MNARLYIPKGFFLRKKPRPFRKGRAVTCCARILLSACALLPEDVPCKLPV